MAYLRIKQFLWILIIEWMLVAAAYAMEDTTILANGVSVSSPLQAPSSQEPSIKSLAVPKTSLSSPEPVILQQSPLLQNAAPSSSKSGRLWNLQDADILSVINEVSQETGKNFVVDPRVSGKITLISSKPLRQGEVYQVFLSVLGLLGYSAIPSAGNVIKIIPNLESAESATRLATRAAPGQGEEVVVRVIALQNISATQLLPVLRPLLPQWSNIAVYPPANVLVLLGRAANLNRILSIIEEVDRSASSNIQMIPLRHASAVQVAHVLNNLQAAARAAGETTAVTIAVDERSNSILLGGPKASRLRTRILISQLDAPASASEGNTEVVYLRYLQAKTFAPVLAKIAQNIMGKGSSSAGGGEAASSDTSSSTSQASSSSGNLGSSGNASSSETSGGLEQKESITSSTYIQAETSTNAVVITAPPALMAALKLVVAKLDIRPAQVMVEAIIAQIDENNLESLGIQWGSVQNNAELASVTTDSLTSYPKLGAGVVGLIPHVKIGAVLSALRNQTGVDILSTPQIMVLDNQKATIEIGQDVPVQTGSYTTPTGGGTPAGPTPFNTTDYKKVTLKLDVTPQINLGSSVRLQLELKNDTLQNPQNPGITPLINTSSIKNAVIINSDDVLVLGGLMSNVHNESVNKVPILSSVPVLGKLFTQKGANEQKRNLMVFIKPVILSTGTDGMVLSQVKYEATKRMQANYTEEMSRFGDEPPMIGLPAWNSKHELPSPFKEDSSSYRGESPSKNKSIYKDGS